MSAPATLIGRVQSVTGKIVSVRLQHGQTSLVMVEGESHRIGQIGSMVRIPLGYTHLYGICSQVGAAAIPNSLLSEPGKEIDSRWMTVTLFGEAIGDEFERGVSQYPTIDDEVHIATTAELAVIYNETSAAPLEVGHLAAARSIPAVLNLASLVSRHSVVVGSTGAGKSNLVAVLLESIAEQGYPSARVLVIDPHGEYADAVGENGVVFSVSPNAAHHRQLYVPYWALPFEEFVAATMGELSPPVTADIRNVVRLKRRDASAHLATAPDLGLITADTPIPFSAKHLWFELNDYEMRTYEDSSYTTTALLAEGDPETLTPNEYKPYAMGSRTPFKGGTRSITRQLDMMKHRLKDNGFAFLLDPGPDYTPNADGRTDADLDQLLRSWVGHDKPVTVLDLSGAAADTLPVVIGTVLRLVSDALYWAGNLPVGSREQPLLIVLEEAHTFVREGTSSAAHRAVDQIAKEGRKHGVGLMLVSQRPTDLDSTALSQCGTMIALRLTNQADRSRVAAALPDELTDLVNLLPALRTGEAIVTGEAVKVPSRFRIRKARHKPVGSDPDLATGWRMDPRPDPLHYTPAVNAWRTSTAAATATDENKGPES
jgi:hypothetical protein